MLAHLDELHSKSRKVEGSTNEMMTVYEMLVDGKDALLKRLLEKKVGARETKPMTKLNTLENYERPGHIELPNYS